MADICRILHEPLGHAETDLRNCFDRILLFIAKICLRRLGLASEAVDFEVAILKEMKCYVTTACGTSEQFFSNSGVLKKHGIGQGLGWSGECWKVVHYVKLNAMSHFFGVTTTNPSGSILTN